MEDEMGIISYSFYTQATKQCLWHYDCHVGAYGLRILLVRVDSQNDKGENCEIIEFAWLEITMLKVSIQWATQKLNCSKMQILLIFALLRLSKGPILWEMGKG